MDFVVSLLVVTEVYPTSEVGTPMRRGYVDPMRWMVIYEYGVPGRALNLNSTNYPDHCHYGDPPLSGTHGGAVVKALRYKPEGRRIDSRWCQNFSLT
jgi:hypothetical protein